MKNIVDLIFLILISCQPNQEAKPTLDNLSFERLDKSINNQDSLFIFKIEIDENIVTIIPPKNSDFELPDSSEKPKSIKSGDFNADGKKDILVYLGACGTGGCMYGLFLNQYANFYRLVFFEYLKNAEFKIEKDGLWTIESSEELEPYNPSKIQITTFKFDRSTYQYKLDTTYVYSDKETEILITK